MHAAATPSVDLRLLKDQAIAAVEHRAYSKAALLYLRIASGEHHDPSWRQRAGEAFRRGGHAVAAGDQFTMAAIGYAHNGFKSCALALCRLAITVDPKNQSAAELLERLR